MITGARLREIRRQLGLTQAELAVATGYSREAINRMEREALPMPDGPLLPLALAALIAGLEPAE